MIKAGIKSNCSFIQNREGTIQIMTEWMKIDREDGHGNLRIRLEGLQRRLKPTENGLRPQIEEAKRAPR